MDTIIPYVIPIGSQKPKPVTLVPLDPGSRYKTRQLQVQVVGKSKMIKTVLLNILDVAKDMQVPPSYVGVFMGYDIGAQAKFDTKKPERQQAFLSGEHEPKDLSRIMTNFINEVLLCPVCGLPEILLKPEQNSVFGTCRACGSHSELKIQNEKFKRYVINHPPAVSKGAFGGNKAGTKAAPAKSNRELKDEDKQDKQEKEKTSKPKKLDDDGVVWFSDTSEEAARKRREEMLPQTADAMLSVSNGTADDKKSSIDEITLLLQDASISSVSEKLQQMKTKKGLDDKTIVTALFNKLFPPTADIVAEIKTKSEAFAKFVGTQAGQFALLDSVESWCGKETSSLSKVSFILKGFYDEELLDEENVIEWHGKKTSTTIDAVRTQAAPFVKWLKEAEEEGSEEEEEEEEEK